MSLTPEQLKIRLSGITGTDISKIIGANDYGGPIDVFIDKLGEELGLAAREVVLNHHIHRGIFYERPTAEWHAHQRGAKLIDGLGTLVHPTNKIVVATPDFLLDTNGEEIDLSIKVPSPHTRHKWGRPGTDGAPPYAVAQVQWELLILKETRGITRAEIVAPLDGDLAVFPVEADPELQAMMLEAAERFWRDHILTKTPPPPDHTKRYAEFLEQQFPQPSKIIVPADSEVESAIEELRVTRRVRKEAEETETALENKLKARLGELQAGGFIASTGAKFTWSKSNRKYVDYAAILSEARVPSDLIEKHTSHNPTSRCYFRAPGEK